MVLRYFGSRLVSLRDVEDKRIQALLEHEPRGPRQNPDVRIILCQETGGRPKLTLYDSAISLASPESEKLDKTQKTESSWNPFASRSRASMNIRLFVSHPLYRFYLLFFWIELIEYRDIKRNRRNDVWRNSPVI